MKVLSKSLESLNQAGRWDIDFHLPPVEIQKFSKSNVVRIDTVADIAKTKRDPNKKPDDVFQYIDIASVDVAVGVISNPQELRGDEAPSRARKVVQAFDIIVSTCRPTRGAIAVVSESLHNQIASTAFSIVRAKPGVNPFYLHYALRLPSTLEQFRKWSTGSSYPAILDDDVKKTRIPFPSKEIQDEIAKKVIHALSERERAIQIANIAWNDALTSIENVLTGISKSSEIAVNANFGSVTIAEIEAKLKELPPLITDKSSGGEELQMDFEEIEDE